jgi:guanylate kinase
MTQSDTPQGLLVVISGPSGVGKTTIVHRLIAAFGGTFSVSATTRPKTDQDTEGVDYIFLDEAEFQKWIDADRFLEYAQVFGRSWYGTPREPVEADLAQGKIVVLDIDVQGAIQVHETMPSSYGIFVLPPSEEELLHRLRHRGREDEATIERRFAEARHEIQIARTCMAYKEFVVNDDLEQAASRVIELVRLRRCGDPH